MPDRGSASRSGLRLIRGAELSNSTAQTAGMIRTAAISGDHIQLDTEPGDYVWVPPHVPHREENPAAGETAVVVIARSTQEAIVVNVAGL